jgi:hypothetical protein
MCVLYFHFCEFLDVEIHKFKISGPVLLSLFRILDYGSVLRNLRKLTCNIKPLHTFRKNCPSMLFIISACFMYYVEVVITEEFDR